MAKGARSLIGECREMPISERAQGPNLLQELILRTKVVDMRLVMRPVTRSEDTNTADH